MKLSIDKKTGLLTLEMSCYPKPAPSKSGKTLVVASSQGNVKTSCMVDDKPVTVGFNAYIGR